MTHPESSDSIQRPSMMSCRRPAPRIRTYLLIAAAFGTSILLTGWIGGSEEELVSGRLAARTSVVRVPVSGEIVEWLTDGKKPMHAGVKLATVIDGELQQRIDVQRAEVATLQLEWKRSQAQAEVDLAWRLSSLEGEILSNRLKEAELIKREFDHRIELQAWKSALRKLRPGIQTSSPDNVFRPVSFLNTNGLGISSRLKVMKKHENTRNAVEVVRVKLRLCEDRLRMLKRLKKELPEKVRLAAGVNITASRLSAAKNELKRLESLPLKQTVLTNAYGRLLKQAMPGDSLKAGDVLARIIDEEHRFLTVPVPAAMLGWFEVGNTMRLRFPGRQPKPLQGKVVRIGPAPQDGSDTVPVRIEPTGRLWPKFPLGTAVQIVLKKP